MEKQWDIWKPANNNPDWRPDEQTYAIESGKGYYNTETFALIDKTISYSAYGSAISKLELTMQHNDEIKSELEAERKKVKELKAALEFYADSDNWGHISPSEAIYAVIAKDDFGDGSFKISETVDDERVGGKRARQALAELEQGE